MRKSLILALGWIAVAAAPAHADSLSCRSINGATTCTGSGGLSCRIENGKVDCKPGAKGGCKIVGDETVCRNGNVTQTFRNQRADAAQEPDDEAPEDEDDSGLKL